MTEDDPTLSQMAPRSAEPEWAGKYRITGRIGHGGMGVVYRAVDDDLGRTVALKFIPPEFREDSQSAQRFLREARAASALDHPNIGTIFGVEETEDHRRFIVMAFYEGRNLNDRMKDEVQPLTSHEAVLIATQIARGLAAAHAHGVIHRDIKPSNILITRDGSVKIIDFGLAAMADSEQLTMPGTSMGTPAYMSPEQALGKAVDQRTDLWSLGVVLMEMLTRQRLFRADSAAGVLYQVVHQEITALQSLQAPMRAIVGKALERDPDRRYRSAKDFLAALEATATATATVTISARPAGFTESAGAGAPRSRRMVMTAVTLLVVLIGIGFWYRSIRNHPAIAGAPRSASAFSKYRQAVDLMKRWDREGNLDHAAALLTEATRTDPAFALGFARLAETQRLRFALSRDQSALESANKNAEEALRLNPELAPVQVTWGRVQALRGNNDLAMASFEKAVQIDPNDADAQLAIARQYERLGRLADAEAAFQKAGMLDPDGISPHDFYANFLYRQGRFPDAIREWQTAIRIAPDNSATWVNLGAAQSENGQLEEAITAYKQALTLKTTDMAYNNLGALYGRAKHYADAVDAFRKAIGITSGNYLFHGNLAESYQHITGSGSLARESFARAIELGEQARKENPRDATVQRNLASYYAQTGNKQLALQRIGTALTIAPAAPDIQAGGAEVYEILGDRRKALALAKRALELGYPRRRMEDSELAPLLSELK